MSNNTEIGCCEEARKKLEKCIDYYSGIPTGQAKCHKLYENVWKKECPNGC